MVIAVVVATNLLTAGTAQAQLRIATYNVAQIRGDAGSIQDVLREASLDGSRGFAVPVAVYVFQEVQTADVSTLDTILDVLGPQLGTNYAMATFTSSGSEDGSGGAQAAFYRTDMLSEIPAAHLDLFTGAGRYADRWKFQLNGYTSDEAAFYLYSMHLKAGDESGDATLRASGVNTVRTNANALPAGTHIIYAGDMNFSSNGEAGYAGYFASGVGQAFDPLGTGSWSGPANARKHTQSPRSTNSAGGLIGGGMDDRFDFQLPNASFNDGSGLAYISNSYRALGNDASHYNQALNASTNFYYPTDLPRSNALALDLVNASDHVPVIVDYQVPAVLAASLLTGNFGRVIVGAPVEVSFAVFNFVTVADPAGVDALDFTATGSNGISGAVSDTVFYPTGGTFMLPVDTSVAASINGTIALSTSSEGASILTGSLSPTGTVVAPSNASFDDAIDIDAHLVPVSFDADTGVQTIDVTVHNFGFTALQAALDVDGVSALSAPFSFVGGLQSGVEDVPATLTFAFDTDGAAAGAQQAVIDIDVSDEDIPGAATDTLQLTLAVTINGGGNDCPWDSTGDGGMPDGVVDTADFFALLQNWGACPAEPQSCPWDSTGDGGVPDGVVDTADFFALLQHWGACD
jgi:endonuclease/exonuclease/phosphatase family metal-dependent hydrolase